MQKPVWGLRAIEDPLAPGVPGCPFSIQGRAAPEARAMLIAAQVQEGELTWGDAPFCPDRRREGSAELPTLMPKAGTWSPQHRLWGHVGGPSPQPRLPLLQRLRAALCA